MTYFRIASYLLLIVGTSHLVGHFILLPHFLLSDTGIIPGNETERELLALMNNYHRIVGGSSVSMMDIQNGLSLCYSLLFFWIGGINILIAKPVRRNHRLLARISFLNASLLFAGVIVAMLYFFWLPVVSFGAPSFLYLLAGVIFRKSGQF
jgi:hypothetical protein